MSGDVHSKLALDERQRPAQAALHAPIFVQVLGGFRIVGPRGEQSAAALMERRHVVAVLALAAATREGTSRARVVGALWPQLDETQALNRLYNCMHMIRRVLGQLAWADDWIRIEAGRVVLDARIVTDARLLEIAAESAFMPQSDQDLWWLIEHCGDAWAPEVEAGELGESVRRGLRSHYLSLLRAVAGRYAQRGTDSRLRRRVLRRLLQENPIDEWALAQVLELDAAAWRTAAVARTYDRARRDLATRAGLRPADRLTLLAAQAARPQASAMLAAPPASASVVTSALIGRDSWVEAVVQQLLQATGTWNVRGLPGVGKSALVQKVARQLAPLLSEGVTVICGDDARRHGGFAAAALAALGVNAAGDTTSADHELARQLCSRQWLLVLDDADEPTSPPLPAWPECDAIRSRVVAVSRFRLPGGWRDVEVPPLDVSHSAKDVLRGLLCAADSGSANTRRAPLTGASDLYDDPGLLELAGLLDGIPRALEVCARYSRTLALGELSDLLRRAAHDPRSTSEWPSELVESEMTSMVGRTSDLARGMLEQAATFDGDFSVQDLLWVCRRSGTGLADLTEHEAERELDDLVGIGVVSRRPRTASEPARYRLLHLVRIHAAKLALVGGRWSHVVHAWLAWLVEHQCPPAPGHESPLHERWLASVAACRLSLERGMTVAAELDERTFVSIAEVIGRLWIDHHAPDDALRWIERAVNAARRLERRRSTLTLLLVYARLLLDARRPDDALANCEQAMAVCDALGEPADRALAIVLQVEALVRSGQVAHGLLLLYPEVQRHQPDTPGHLTLQAAWMRQRRFAVDGIECSGSCFDTVRLEDVRRLFRGARCWLDVLEALAAGHSGMSAPMRAELAAELACWAHGAGSLPWLDRALRSQALAALAVDDPSTARMRMTEAWRLAANAERGWHAFTACLTLAEIDWRSGQPQRALVWLEEAAHCTAAHADPFAQVYLCASRCAAWSIMGHAVDAYFAFMRIQAAELRSIDPLQMWLITEAAALLARALGLSATARRLTDHVFALPSETADVPLTARFRASVLPKSSVAATCTESVPPALRLAEARIELARFLGELTQASVRNTVNMRAAGVAS